MCKPTLETVQGGTCLLYLYHSHMQGSLSDDEIIDFFRYGERKQIRLTRKITVLCGLLKSNKDIILNNTFNPFEC